MKNLLVAIDFSDVTDRVVSTAAELARAFGAKMWLLHVVAEPSPMASLSKVAFQMPAIEEEFHWPTVESEVPELFHDKQRQMQEILAGLNDKGINAEASVVRGPVVVEILTMAEQHAIDMIVVGSHGHGALYELMVGTVSEGVIRHAACPALIVPSVKLQKQRVVREWEETVVVQF